ncbi:ABC transporter permease [Mesobacterium pallidum]|uniref:ABC transporter permease n=1 Tax=Mesobacterium pallidum TaxID=2872037 RepID=UPI001EE17FB9|nr:ABC transporter permease [Mesobacterium pallidum]
MLTFAKACYRHRTARFALLTLFIMAMLAIFAPVIAPQDPYETKILESMLPPGGDHLMGTDLAGRDIFARVLIGGRVSLVIGLFAVAISVTIGCTIGLLSGFYGGRFDNIVMRLIDVMMAFPGILLAMSIVAVLGTGLVNVIIAVGVGGITEFARVSRGSVLAIKQQVYVDAARSTGASDARIIFRHILPNAFPPIIVLASMSYGWALLSATGLSFLGLGAAPPAAEWGAMLSDGRNVMWDAPWAAIFPGIAILFTVLASNLLGDAIRDILDPKLKV